VRSQEKDYNKSLNDFIKAYELNCQTLEIKILKIILYEITGSNPLRSAYLSSVFNDELLNANANYLYGYYLLEYLYDTHTAIKYFDKAIELDPYYYDAYIYRNMARKKKEGGIHIIR
jgi:tetratricopeptide (TPR) repeat protein